MNAQGEEVMMNSNEYIECENVLEKALSSGRKVAMVTAKDKLRDLLGGHNLARGTPNGIALSTEHLKDAKSETHGIDYQHIMNKLMIKDRAFTSSFNDGTFSIYSGEASINALKLGFVSFFDFVSIQNESVDALIEWN